MENVIIEFSIPRGMCEDNGITRWRLNQMAEHVVTVEFCISDWSMSWLYARNWSWIFWKSSGNWISWRHRFSHLLRSKFANSHAVKENSRMIPRGSKLIDQSTVVEWYEMENDDQSISKLCKLLLITCNLMKMEKYIFSESKSSGRMNFHMRRFSVCKYLLSNRQYGILIDKWSKLMILNISECCCLLVNNIRIFSKTRKAQKTSKTTDDDENAKFFQVTQWAIRN